MRRAVVAALMLLVLMTPSVKAGSPIQVTAFYVDLGGDAGAMHGATVTSGFSTRHTGLPACEVSLPDGSHVSDTTELDQDQDRENSLQIPVEADRLVTIQPCFGDGLATDAWQIIINDRTYGPDGHYDGNRSSAIPFQDRVYPVRAADNHGSLVIEVNNDGNQYGVGGWWGVIVKIYDFDS